MTKVTLRMKPISGNRQTLYLDYYPPIPHPASGKQTRREFLKLFVFDETDLTEQTYTDGQGKLQRRFVPVFDRSGKPKKVKLNETDKQYNKETFALAEAIKAKRQLAIQKGNYGFLSDEKRNADFVAYFESLANKRKGSNSDNWFSALHYLKDFTEGSLIKFKDVNETFCNDFKEYLQTAPSRKSKKATLSQNSTVSYFNKVKATLNQAHKDGHLETDLNKRIDGIKQAETERGYLTLDELQVLVNTPCTAPILKQAALFSALTGLRFSDIKKLLWSEVQYSEQEGFYIRFRQKKTKGTETLPISEQAFDLLGERREATELVFVDLAYSFTQTDLPKWLRAAGVIKNITFHCFRHTYATLQISLGTDLYTVSKMLGHREIKTTQVYAKIINKQKREAANKIQLQF